MFRRLRDLKRGDHFIREACGCICQVGDHLDTYREELMEQGINSAGWRLLRVDFRVACGRYHFLPLTEDVWDFTVIGVDPLRIALALESRAC